MDESWHADMNGAAPSFQEFLAAEHAARTRFVNDSIASRRLSPRAIDAAALADCLACFGSALAGNRGETERLLDDLVRVRMSHAARVSRGSLGELG